MFDKTVDFQFSFKELTSKKGYKSRRDRDNADLLKINVAKLERDLQSLYDEE